MTLIAEQLFESFDASVQPVNEAMALPPQIYTSEEFYDFERRAIFEREWLCVGRADQLREPGDYLALNIAGEPLLVVRGRDGEVRVLSAVCRHRGMVLAESSGHCTTFTCPYHRWVYDLEGKLTGAPAMDRAVGFDKADHGLPSLQVELWNGFVFASFASDPAPISPRLSKLEPILGHYDLATSVTLDGGTLADLPWNWKVMMENFNDPYHASRLHGAMQTFAPSHLNEFPVWDDDDAAIGRVQHFTHIDASFNPTQRALLPVFPGLTEEDRKRGSFILIPPTLALAVVPDEVAYFIICPQGPGSITIHIGYCFERTALAHPLFDLLFEQAKSGVNNFNVQDVDADRRVQIGLNSRFAPRGRYSWQEETLRQFNCWLVSRYRSEWSRQRQAGDGDVSNGSGATASEHNQHHRR
jgi:phenylpropionate dioxygenase-like ring-hydroxylating dioxygenase large terminal subunit